MQADEIRLELLKLVYKHHEAETLSVAKAQILEAYVLQNTELKSKPNKTEESMDRAGKPSRSIYAPKG